MPGSHRPYDPNCDCEACEMFKVMEYKMHHDLAQERQQGEPQGGGKSTAKPIAGLLPVQQGKQPVPQKGEASAAKTRAGMTPVQQGKQPVPQKGETSAAKISAGMTPVQQGKQKERLLLSAPPSAGTSDSPVPAVAERNAFFQANPILAELYTAAIDKPKNVSKASGWPEEHRKFLREGVKTFLHPVFNRIDWVNFGRLYPEFCKLYSDDNMRNQLKNLKKKDLENEQSRG